MGAQIDSTPDKTPPLTVRGSFPLKPIQYHMPMASAQVKSAILLAGLFADGTTRVYEKNQTRNHTERLLGLEVRRTSDAFVAEVEGGRAVSAKQFQIPGDISSAAFLIAAGLIVPGSEIKILDTGLNPTRARIIELFRSVGGSIDVSRESIAAGESFGDLIVRSSQLHGNVVLETREVVDLIDEIPVIATTFAVTGVGLTVRGAADLRNKESDRIGAVVQNLRKIGLEVEEYADGFAFQPENALISATCDSFGDHRIAMAFGIAGLALPGKMTVTCAECVDISFPGFWGLLDKLQVR